MNSDYMLRVGGRVFDLLTQPRNMIVYCSSKRIVVVIPNFVEQLLARDGLSLTAREIFQYVELARRKLQQLSALLRLITLEVDLHIAEFEALYLDQLF